MSSVEGKLAGHCRGQFASIPQSPLLSTTRLFSNKIKWIESSWLSLFPGSSLEYNANNNTTVFYISMLLLIWRDWKCLGNTGVHIHSETEPLLRPARGTPQTRPTHSATKRHQGLDDSTEAPRRHREPWSSAVAFNFKKKPKTHYNLSYCCLAPQSAHLAFLGICTSGTFSFRWTHTCTRHVKCQWELIPFFKLNSNNIHKTQNRHI